MKVIFLKEVKGQGKKGQVKEVSEGYAHNFLLPKGLAALASEGSMKQLDNQNKAEQWKKDQEKEKAKALAAQIDAVTAVIKAKSGGAGRLFGSITTMQIADALQTHRISIDKRKIVMENPIRTAGDFEVLIKLHPEVSAKIKVQVVEEK